MPRNFEPYPCNSQRAVMESMGFSYSKDQVQPHGTDWHGPFDLTLNLPDHEELTQAAAAAMIIHRALCAGKADIQKALKKLLAV